MSIQRESEYTYLEDGIEFSISTVKGRIRVQARKSHRMVIEYGDNQIKTVERAKRILLYGNKE